MHPQPRQDVHIEWAAHENPRKHGYPFLQALRSRNGSIEFSNLDITHTLTSERYVISEYSGDVMEGTILRARERTSRKHDYRQWYIASASELTGLRFVETTNGNEIPREVQTLLLPLLAATAPLRRRAAL